MTHDTWHMTCDTTCHTQATPWIWKWGRLESSGGRIIFINSKTKRIAFYFATNKSMKNIFWGILICLRFLQIICMAWFKNIYFEVFFPSSNFVDISKIYLYLLYLFFLFFVKSLGKGFNNKKLANYPYFVNKRWEGKGFLASA